MTLKEYIMQHYSRKSVRRYISQIEQFKAYQGGRIDDTKYSEVVEYLGVLRARNLHPKTIGNHLLSIKLYFRYLKAIGKRKDHPCESLYLKDQINRAIKVEELYSMETLEKLYTTFETKDKRPGREKPQAIKKRDKIILSLLIYQALTTSEIIELRVNDINLEEGTITIKPAKNPGKQGNKGRILPLKSKQILLFNDYITKYRIQLWKKQKPSSRTDYFILSEQGLQLWGGYLNRMLSSQGNQRFTPMKIRQSVIAHLLKENKDLRIVQEFAGHRKAGSTEAYKRSGFEELKSSIEKLHPRQ